MAPRTIICKFYARGFCKKGDQCTFFHEFSGSSSESDEDESEKETVDAVTASEPEPDTPARGKRETNFRSELSS